MMVVFIFLKKKIEWSDESLDRNKAIRFTSPDCFYHLKKKSKPRHTSYSVHRRHISWRRPCFAAVRFFFWPFFIFLSIKLRVHSRQSSWRPLRICRKRRPSLARGSLGSIYILVSSPPVYTVRPAACYKFMALIMGLNSLCNLILK